MAKTNPWHDFAINYARILNQIATEGCGVDLKALADKTGVSVTELTATLNHATSVWVTSKEAFAIRQEEATEKLLRENKARLEKVARGRFSEIKLYLNPGITLKQVGATRGVTLNRARQIIQESLRVLIRQEFFALMEKPCAPNEGLFEIANLKKYPDFWAKVIELSENK